MHPFPRASALRAQFASGIDRGAMIAPPGSGPYSRPAAFLTDPHAVRIRAAKPEALADAETAGMDIRRFRGGAARCPCVASPLAGKGDSIWYLGSVGDHPAAAGPEIPAAVLSLVSTVSPRQHRSRSAIAILPKIRGAVLYAPPPSRSPGDAFQLPVGQLRVGRFRSGRCVLRHRAFLPILVRHGDSPEFPSRHTVTVEHIRFHAQARFEHDLHRASIVVQCVAQRSQPPGSGPYPRPAACRLDLARRSVP